MKHSIQDLVTDEPDGAPESLVTAQIGDHVYTARWKPYRGGDRNIEIFRYVITGITPAGLKISLDVWRSGYSSWRSVGRNNTSADYLLWAPCGLAELEARTWIGHNSRSFHTTPKACLEWLLMRRRKWLDRLQASLEQCKADIEALEAGKHRSENQRSNYFDW